MTGIQNLVARRDSLLKRFGQAGTVQFEIGAGEVIPESSR